MSKKHGEREPQWNDPKSNEVENLDLEDLEKRRFKPMRNMKIRVALGTLIAVAALITLRATFPGGTLPKVHAQEEARKGCSLDTLEGGYGVTFSGLFTRGAVPAAINNFTPVAGVGLVTFDGDGNLSDLGSTSVGGQIVPVNVTGTYTVNSDCTGTFTTPNAHLNLVIVRNGREIRALNTGLGNVVFDNFVKQ